MNDADWMLIGNAAMSFILALCSRPRGRYLLALLKGALIGAVAGPALYFPFAYHGGPLDEVQRWLLMFGLVQGTEFGILGGMIVGVFGLRARLRGERRSVRVVEAELPHPELPAVQVFHPTRRPWLISLVAVVGIAVLALAGIRGGGQVLCVPVLAVDVMFGFVALRAVLSPSPQQIQFDDLGIHITLRDDATQDFAWDELEWPREKSGGWRFRGAGGRLSIPLHLWGRKSRWLEGQMVYQHIGARLEREGAEELLNGRPVSARGLAGRVLFLADGLQTRGGRGNLIPYDKIVRVRYEHEGYLPRAFTLTVGKQRLRLPAQAGVLRLLRERAAHAVWEEFES